MFERQPILRVSFTSVFPFLSLSPPSFPLFLKINGRFKKKKGGLNWAAKQERGLHLVAALGAKKAGIA